MLEYQLHVEDDDDILQLHAEDDDDDATSASC
jgi:hypothetical protein